MKNIIIKPALFLSIITAVVLSVIFIVKSDAETLESSYDYTDTEIVKHSGTDEIKFKFIKQQMERIEKKSDNLDSYLRSKLGD